MQLHLALYSLPPRPAIPQAPGKHISPTLNVRGRPKRLVLSSWKGCCQVVTAISPLGPLRWTNRTASDVGHSPGPESRARSEHFPPPGKLRGSWCKLLISLPRPSGKDTGHSGGTSPQYKATSSLVSWPHLPLVPITPAQRRHSVSYPLAGHHSPTLWPA